MGDECTAVPGTFTCPPTFTEVINTEGLCVEDVDDDDQELWVIQASCDVDFADLNDQQLLLNSQTLLQLPSYEDEIIEVLPKDTLDLDNQLNEEITNAHLVLPNRSSMELQTVKKDFKGFLFVNRNVLVSQLNLIEDEPKNSTRPENLKKHDKAFGSGDPLGFFGMDGNTAAEDFMESASETSQNSRKKHSRSTKDHRHSEHIAAKSKKKHHRDKKEQVAVEIKTEVTSDYEKSLSSSEESKETKDKRHKTVDSENNNLRVSHDEENAVPRMKKEKKRRTVVDEVTENELPSEIAELELSEHSPSKLHRKKNKHKKKHKSPDSSHMEEEDFDTSSQDKKAKHKSRRLKEIPSEESLDYQNNSMCIPEVQIKQEIFDEHLNGLDLGNSLSHSKKKKSKKEKKRHRE